MQIPHHGSRRNINPALIKVFSPTIAWVSAEGTNKHPRRAVVNAFKNGGAIVHSTHYPTPTNMWISTGTVSSRVGYKPLVPLYDASLAKGVADLGADLTVTPAQSASRPQLAVLDADAESA